MLEDKESKCHKKIYIATSALAIILKEKDNFEALERSNVCLNKKPNRLETQVIYENAYTWSKDVRQNICPFQDLHHMVKPKMFHRPSKSINLKKVLISCFIFVIGMA